MNDNNKVPEPTLVREDNPKPTTKQPKAPLPRTIRLRLTEEFYQSLMHVATADRRTVPKLARIILAWGLPYYQMAGSARELHELILQSDHPLPENPTIQ